MSPTARTSLLLTALAAVVTSVAAVVAPGPGAVGAGPTTTAPRPTTTVGPTTTAAAPPTLPEPESAERDPVRTVVPSIVAFPEPIASEQQRQQAITTALTERHNTVALQASPALLCAIVPLTAPLTTAGRWERDGEPFISDDSARRDPPGYGDCITAGEGEVFEEGVYQYVAVGPTGATSAAATLVVGVPSVVVWLLNNGDQPVCLVQASPEAADFYESFDAPESPIGRGQALAIGVAAVEQNVRVFGCPPDDVLRSFDLVPEFGVYVELFESPPPGGTATSTTTRPTTTG
jgi:hypothetical protein